MIPPGGQVWLEPPDGDFVRYVERIVAQGETAQLAMRATARAEADRGDGEPSTAQAPERAASIRAALPGFGHSAGSTVAQTGLRSSPATPGALAPLKGVSIEEPSLRQIVDGVSMFVIAAGALLAAVAILMEPPWLDDPFPGFLLAIAGIVLRNRFGSSTIRRVA